MNVPVPRNRLVALTLLGVVLTGLVSVTLAHDEDEHEEYEEHDEDEHEEYEEHDEDEHEEYEEHDEDEHEDEKDREDD